MPGEVRRSCQLELPHGAAVLLRELPQMHSFDETSEVLDMIRPGYGLKDAPRLWSLALKRALTAMHMTSCKADPELHVLHENGWLALIMSTHVDDLKFGGTPEKTAQLLKHLENQFDKLKISRGSFEHCGVMHKQDPKTFATTIDQHH